VIVFDDGTHEVLGPPAAVTLDELQRFLVAR
jgi:hypothetical protein